MPATRVQQQAEARGLDFRQMEVTCPAGAKCELPLGVECRIEESFVSASHMPSSLGRFCMGAYTECPTWRTDKENTWAEKATYRDHPKRPKRTLLDQDPEMIPTYRIPRDGDGSLPEQL